MWQKDKKVECQYCLSHFCLNAIMQLFPPSMISANIIWSSANILWFCLMWSRGRSNTSLPSRGLFNHRPALPYLPPSPRSATQPHPHPPPLLEHILPLASVCKAVSSFQHLQQMYVELKPVSNSCVYKTLFAQTRVIHLKLKPLLSLQCR